VARDLPRNSGVATPVTVIRGDGIGPEVIDAAIRVLDSSGVDLAWEPAEAGAVANIKMGDALPDETLRSIRRTRLCLKGPLETPIGSGYRSANARLRAELDLYANLRPVRSYTGVETPFRDVDLAIVRENTEGEYAGVERYVDHDGGAAECVSTTTLAASQRIVRYAFEYAARHRRRKVTLVHKANILKLTSGLFLQAGRDMAKHYSGIEFEEMIVDNAAMQLVMNPSRFRVIVTSNLFGDILSELAAGLVGGLGLAAGMNVGEKAAVLEPIHGTAPDIAGKGIANPAAAIVAGAMLLRHMEEVDAADRIDSAVRLVIAERKHVTPDLGGHASTGEFADWVAGVLRTLRSGVTSLR
jgi:isocitrate dehydrogenase (NAD+)